MPAIKLASIGAISCLLAAACGQSESAKVLMDPWIGDGDTTVLVDGIHQLEGIPDAVFDEHEFRYSHSQSASRVFANLLPHGFRFRHAIDGTLSYDLLKGHDILYFNVPTAIASGSSKADREMPRLRPGEVEAIRRYLEEGGSALILCEHNNVYDHIEVLKPLLEPLGIHQVSAYASETGRGRFAMDVGGYILMIRNFDEQHPVTAGLRMVSWSGGGPFTPQTKGGVAFLSETGFIDFGNYITKKPSKYSNHRIDEGEYQGPDIPVILAREVGKGRLVIAADHNMLGTQWLGVGDNLPFIKNAMQWLARREGEPPFRDTPAIGLKLGFEQEHSGWSVGLRDRDGFYGFFYHLCRRPDVSPLALLSLDDDVDVLGFLDPQVEYPGDELKKIDAVLEGGKRLFVLVDGANPGAGGVQLMKRYLPHATLTGAGGKVAIRDLSEGKTVSFPAREGFGRIRSAALESLDGARIAALDHSESGYKGRRGQDIRPKSYRKAQPYLLDVRVEGGEPLVSAELPDGGTVSIIDRFAVGGGEILLMVQGEIFTGNTLPCIREELAKTNRPAFELLMRLSDWLAARPPHTAVAPPSAPPADAGPEGQ